MTVPTPFGIGIVISLCRRDGVSKIGGVNLKLLLDLLTSLLSALLVSIGTLLDLVSGLDGLLLGDISTNVELAQDPVPTGLRVLSDLSKDGTGRCRGSVLEVGPLAAGESTELVDG